MLSFRKLFTTRLQFTCEFANSFIMKKVCFFQKRNGVFQLYVLLLVDHSYSLLLGSDGLLHFQLFFFVIDKLFIESSRLLLPVLHLLLILNQQLVYRQVLLLQFLHSRSQLPHLPPSMLGGLFPHRILHLGHSSRTGRQIIQRQISIPSTEVKGMFGRLHRCEIDLRLFLWFGFILMGLDKAGLS